MKVEQVGEGSVENGSGSGAERSDRICSYFHSLLWQSCLRVEFKLGHGPIFGWVPVLHKVSLCFNEPGSKDYIYANRLPMFRQSALFQPLRFPRQLGGAILCQLQDCVRSGSVMVYDQCLFYKRMDDAHH